MYDVTIAIPLYNAEQYIGTTMNSALEQTFQNIEFLIIDDAGKDNSIGIIHDLQKTHSRGKNIRIIEHKENSGVAIARNTAIKEARGKYLYFLDSDDIITQDCIEILYNAIEQNNSEIAIASHRHISEGNKELVFKLPYLVINEKDKLATLRYGNLHQSLGFFIWNIMYRLSFLQDHQLYFKNHSIGEDIVFLYDLLPQIQSCVLLPNITYSYIKRKASLSQYGERKLISKQEIEEQIQIRIYGKEKIKELRDKPYIEEMVTNQMKYCFEAAAYIVSQRKLISPVLELQKIKELLKHPLQLKEILKFKKYKISNCLYFYWGKLPLGITIMLLICFLKLLKLSWKLRSFLK